MVNITGGEVSGQGGSITGGTGDYQGAAGAGSLFAKIHDGGVVTAEFTGIPTH